MRVPTLIEENNILVKEKAFNLNRRLIKIGKIIERHNLNL